MSGMTSERLADIRERATCPSATQAVQIGEYEACARALVEHDVPDLLDHIDHLTAENARLEEEVDARTTGQRGGEWVDPEGDYWRDYWRDRALEAEEHGRVYRNFRSATETAYALLNPSTEGDAA